MATGDKADLLAKLSENITDNSNNENTAARHRSYASKIITYCANLAEATKQVFLGEIGFNEQVTFSKNPTYLGTPIYQEAVPTAYCDYESTTEIQLTLAEKKITDWNVAGILTPVGITEVGGTFSTSVNAIFPAGIERAYLNYDQTPSGIVYVNIRIVATAGGVSTDVLNRSLPISAATGNGEPGSLTPFTLKNLAFAAGTEFEIYVSASDGGGEPSDVRLVRAGVSAISSKHLPEVTS